ncbi:hypothetical protein SynMEDNS5_00586 [Synechococcus sp. MEDNS5]|nr:hypothetical protein SynMEDNS5_00586 [Synechococcus sp. MEDNS5]
MKRPVGTKRLNNHDNNPQQSSSLAKLKCCWFIGLHKVMTY